MVVLFLLAFGVFFGCSADAAPEAVVMGQTPALSIDTIIENPRGYQNENVVTATVTTFSTRGDVSVIGLVDNQHILECRNLDCVGSKIYGINVSGQPNPQPGDVITMVGNFEATGDFWIFMISDYRVDSNIIDILR